MRAMLALAFAAVLIQTPRLGSVHFDNSCAASVQPDFGRGMALLHSFEFPAAIDAFAAAAQGDPGCGIAVWGLALAQWGNPFSNAIRSAAQLAAGRASAARAARVGARTRREQAFIDAVAALYREGTPQHTRTLAYRDAMAQVARAYPADPEAQAFYAVALAASADPADQTYRDRLQAASILEPLWRAQPDHPGFAHYLIHAYDEPSLAARGLPAARAYGHIAPDSAHALHMPSHTFTRLGYWQESIETNVLSAQAARRAGSASEELHADDYLAYAYLQTGQDRAARVVVDRAGEIRSSMSRSSSGMASTAAYALAAIPARFALERGDWRAAAGLAPQVTAFPYADAMTWFAKALGAARAGLVPEARAALAGLRGQADRLGRDEEPYWREQVGIQIAVASAWLAFAEGRSAEAIQLLRDGAVREERSDKGAITPGPLAPARELVGDMLMLMHEPERALAAYEAALVHDPNRYRALAGAWAAARASGQRATAGRYASQLAQVAAKADRPRPAGMR